MINKIGKNDAHVVGKIVSEFTFDHKVCGEKFYKVYLAIRRISENVDIIPLMVSERLLNVHENYRGCTVVAVGQFRSYSRHECAKNHLELSVFVHEISFIDEIDECTKNNQIFLDGYICKAPTYRKTPLGREISDILLAVNRNYGKSDYIPFIAWGRNAQFASGFEVGTRVRVWGRIQSREYVKKLEEDVQETRTAYEVSISCMEVVEDEQDNN